MAREQKQGGKEEIAASDNEKVEKAGFFDYYQASISLIKVIIWPLIAICLFFVLKKPIIATFEQLPNLFSKTTTVTIGEITLEIDQRLRNKASPEVEEALSNLSPEALKMMIRTGYAKHFINTGMDSFIHEKEVLEELEDVGLISLTIGITDPNHPENNGMWEATDLGKAAYDFILDVIIDLLPRSAP